FLNQSNVRILNLDFEEAVADCKKGDFVYFDPPYDDINEDTKSFVGYTLNGFGRDEQVRLANVYRDLVERCCYVLLSNANTEFINELYADYHIEPVLAKRSINSKADGRGKVSEVLVRSYDI